MSSWNITVIAEHKLTVEAKNEWEAMKAAEAEVAAGRATTEVQATYMRPADADGT
jgi:hypothetical protein